MSNVLNKVRKSDMARKVTISEVQLSQENPGMNDMWMKIQELKIKIINEKKEAQKAVDDKYDDLMTKLLTDYAFFLKMSR